MKLFEYSIRIHKFAWPFLGFHLFHPRFHFFVWLLRIQFDAPMTMGRWMSLGSYALLTHDWRDRMNKYCRICWNSSGWRLPTGEACHYETGGSYVKNHGFGHEEWLFRFEWLHSDGFRYGFLQPLGRYISAYEGEKFSIALYTVTPQGETLLVGTIKNAYVPTADERNRAFHELSQKGWLSTMREELSDISAAVEMLDEPEPEAIINIRFRQDDVFLFPFRPRVPRNHKIVTNRRYHPFNWDDDLSALPEHPPAAKPPTSASDDDDPTRLEAARTRADVEGVVYDPLHVKLQNRLYRTLQAKHKGCVRYENEFVDLSLHLPGEVTFYEIKIAPTARRCIRLALGQLLEYSHYPDQTKANRLVVVGDTLATQADKTYLERIRKLYRIPIFYSCFDWRTNGLVGLD